jgi:hypothetical protein
LERCSCPLALIDSHNDVPDARLMTRYRLGRYQNLVRTLPLAKRPWGNQSHSVMFQKFRSSAISLTKQPKPEGKLAYC